MSFERRLEFVICILENIEVFICHRFYSIKSTLGIQHNSLLPEYVQGCIEFRSFNHITLNINIKHIKHLKEIDIF